MSEYEVFGTPAELVWQEINLADIKYDKRHEAIREIPDTWGIYIFHRRFGDTSEALYIGKSKALRNRIIQELNALELIEHVKGAKKGTKLLSFAELVAHGNCDKDKYIDDIESVLIQEAVYQGHNLYNIKKTKVHLREVSSSGDVPGCVEEPFYLLR